MGREGRLTRERGARDRFLRHNDYMGASEIPIIILGGCDARPSVLPPAGRGLHPLGSYKAAAIRLHGVPLIAHLVDRLKGCPEFDPIYVAGPKEIYGTQGLSATIIDTDSTFAENIRVAIEWVGSQGPPAPVALMACDVLPDPQELRTFLEDYRRQGDCDLWFPLVRAPESMERLKAFAWKPLYRILPDEHAPTVRVLPGHLVIADPGALRLEFIYRLLEIAYQTRNQPVSARTRVMVRSVLLALLHRDLENVFRLRWPGFTYTVLRNGLFIARGLRAGTLVLRDLEAAATRIAVRPEHRRQFPERGARLPILEGLSLAEDIDTEEEARQLAGVVKSEGGN